MSFIISMPPTVRVGGTAGFRINGQLARVTWPNRDRVVITVGDDELHLFCAAGDGTAPTVITLEDIIEAAFQ